MGQFNISRLFDEYLWQFFMIAFIVVIMGGIIKNFKALTGGDGESRKEGLIDLGWIVVYGMAALGVITAIVTAVKSSKPTL